MEDHLGSIISWQGACPLSCTSRPAGIGLVSGEGFASHCFCTTLLKQRCYQFAFKTLFTVWSVWLGVITFFKRHESLSANSGKNQRLTSVNLTSEEGRQGMLCACSRGSLPVTAAHSRSKGKVIKKTLPTYLFIRTFLGSTHHSCTPKRHFCKGNEGLVVHDIPLSATRKTLKRNTRCLPQNNS